MFNNGKNNVLLLLIVGSLFSAKTMAYVVKDGIDSDNLFFHVNTHNANDGEYSEFGNINTGDKETNAGLPGSSAGATGWRAITAGIKAKAKGIDTIAIGTNAEAGDVLGEMSHYSVAIGTNSIAKRYNDISIGTNAKTGSDSLSGYRTSIGANSSVSGWAGIALGAFSNAQGDAGISIGERSSAKANSSISIGRAASSTQTESIAIGKQADATIARSVALGDGTTTMERGSQTEGNSKNYLKQEIDGTNKLNLAFAGGENVVGVVSVGGKKKEEFISEFPMSEPVEKLARDFFAPPFNMDAYDIDSVSDSLETASRSAVMAPSRIMASRAANTAEIETRRIQNVAPGLISTTSTDAVNGSQLYALAKEVANIPVSGYFHVNTSTGTESGNSGTGDSNTNYGKHDEAGGATGQASLAAGINAKASGRNSLAIGESANANSDEASAFGKNSKASGISSLSLGTDTIASGLSSTSIGMNSEAKADFSLANGVAAISEGASSVSIGFNAKTKENANSSIAIGHNATSKEKNSISLGKSALTEDNNAIAIGSESMATKSRATAIGQSAKAKGEETIALGFLSYAQANKSIAIGSNSTAKEENSIVLGSDSKDRAFTNPTSFKSSNLTFGNFSGNAIGVASVGDKDTERQIINVAPGEISATSTDAINGSQLYATNNILDNVGKSVVNNFGGNAKIDENGNITFTDIGGTGKNTIHEAIKEYSDKVKENSTKIEENKKEIEANKENIRKNSLDIAKNKKEIENNNRLIKDNSDKINENKEAIAVNKKEIDTNKESIRKNSLDIAENKKAILASKTEVFSSDESVKITSSNGDNGQTKYDLSVKVKNIDIKAGNNINVEKNADIYTISSKDTSASTSAASNYLIVNKENAKNVDGVEVTNYKVDLSEETKAKIENTSNNSAQIQRNSEKIENLNDDLHHVGSLSAAMAALNPIQYDSKKPNQIMASIGHYRDHQAVAVGAAHYVNENLLLTAGVAIGGEKRVKSMANVGLTWKFGKGNDDNTPEEYKDGPISSIYAMQEKITKLEIENANYKLKIAELENKLNLLIENMSK
ncbi:MAG: YadA-like family protein [Fusobacterium gastrosuis]|uniref:YadA-like family protein n=2 Tax=Fusobacterium TaxID=848 RepID=UPI002A96E6EC|nr:YadA-like family protein [Fusobacterium gastrosuis]